MKKIRKSISVLLCIAMMLSTNGMITFANSIYEETGIKDTNKIEMQLKEDLGEERADEIINVKNKEKLVNIDDGFNESEANDENSDNERNVDDEQSIEEVFDVIESEDDDISPENNIDNKLKNNKYGEESEEDILVDDENLDILNNNDVTNESKLISLNSNEDIEEKNAIEDVIESDKENVNNNITNDIEEKKQNYDINDFFAISTISEIVEEDEIKNSEENIITATISDMKNTMVMFGAPQLNTIIYWYIDNNVLYLSGTEPTNVNYVSGQSFEEIDSSFNIPWDSQIYSITEVTIDDIISPSSCQYLFANLRNVTTINNLEKLNTSNVESMANMFYECSSLTTIDVSCFDTSKVTNMQSMFKWCGELLYINLNNWDTGNVIDMSNMFCGCYDLVNIDISNLNTSSVINMSSMFSSCSSLLSLDLNNWDTSNVTDMNNMFMHCENLVNLNISEWDTGKVENMFNMFNLGSDISSSSITNLNISNWDTSSVTNMCNMFCSCNSLTSLDLSGWDTSKVTNMSGMFSMYQIDGNCNLTSINLNGWNTSSVTDMYNMFGGCSSLTTLDVSNFNTSNVTDMGNMFYKCGRLTSLDLSGWDTSKVTNMTGMFSMYRFDGSYNLTSINLSNLDTSNVINMNGMFYNYNGLTSLDLSGWNTCNVTDMSRMFEECNNLTTIIVSDDFVVNQVEYDEDMFVGCTSLIGGKGTHYDTSHTDKEYARIDASGNSGYFTKKNDGDVATSSTIYWYIDNNVLHLSGTEPTNVNYVSGQFFEEFASRDSQPWYTERMSITEVSLDDVISLDNCKYLFANLENITVINNLTNLDTSNTTSMHYMFYNDFSLLNIDLSGFVTSNVTSMQAMFYGCKSITTIDVSNFDTSKVTDMSNMFRCCCKQEGQYISALTNIFGLNNFITSEVTNMSNMFLGCTSLSSIDVSYFNTSKVINMGMMFYECKLLLTLDVSNFDTSKVTNMEYMFHDCNSLTTLNVSNFNTSKVTNMDSMFFRCNSLTTLDVSNFDTSNVINISQLFCCCSSLTTLDVSNFDTSKVTDMSNMFYGCENLNELDLSGFNTISVQGGTEVSTTGYYVDGFAGMFAGCKKLEKIDISSFDTGNARNISYMFCGCSSLTILNLSNFDTSNVLGMYGVFLGCSLLTTIYASNAFVTNNVVNSIDMFGSCTSLVGGNGTTYNESYIDKEYARIDAPSISGYFTKKDDGETHIATSSNVYWYLTDNDKTLHLSSVLPTVSEYIIGNDNYNSMSLTVAVKASISEVVIDNEICAENYNSWFDGFKSVVEFDGLTNINTALASNLSKMFLNCNSVINLDLSNFNTNNVTNMNEMFYGCSCLNSLDISNFITNKVKDMSYMFYGCSSLNNLDVSSFNTSKVKNMTCMFYECSSLTKLDLSNFDTLSVDSSGYGMFCMFYGCTNLVNLNVGSFDTSNVTNMRHMFANCSSVKNLDLSSFDTTNVDSMLSMFDFCSSLESIDVSSFNTANVRSMMWMFRGCSSLENLDLSSFNTLEVTNIGGMFSDCSALTKIYVSDAFVTNNVVDSVGMFGSCASLTGGNGTAYNENHIDKEYARIDALSTPGYFTKKNDGADVASSRTIYWYIDNNVLHLSGTEPTNVNYNAGQFFEEIISHDSLPWESNKLKITEVTIDNIISPRNCANLFAGLNSVQNINNIAKLDTSKVTNMEYMFYDCESLSTIDLSNFDTSNVTDMTCMFYGFRFAVLDLSSFDTSNVINMNNMFGGCLYLTTIYVGNTFSMENVTNSNSMFSRCKSIVGGNGTKYDGYHIDAEYARIDADSTPGYFSNIKPIEIRKFNPNDYILDKVWYPASGVDNVKSGEITKIIFVKSDIIPNGTQFVVGRNIDNTQYIYGYLYEKEVTIHIPSDCVLYAPEDSYKLFYTGSYFNEHRGIDIVKVYKCELQSIEGINYLNTKYVKTMQNMFDSQINLTTLDLSSFDTSNVTNMKEMFFDCSSLTDLNVSGFDTSRVTNMSGMFRSCCQLNNLCLDNFDTSSVVDMSEMFNYCSKLQNLYLNSFDTSKVIDMSSMFSRCQELLNLDLSTFNTSKVENFSCMFVGCEKIKNINLLSFNTRNVTDMSSMFKWCYELETIDLTSFNTSNVTNMSYMFNECKKLVNLDLSNFNTINCTNMSHMFGICLSLESLNISNFNTSNVGYMGFMFWQCESLEVLDISSFNTNTRLFAYVEPPHQGMFIGCKNLRTIYVSENLIYDTNAQLFSGCINLVGGNGFEYDSSIYSNPQYYLDNYYYCDNLYAYIDSETTPGYFTYKESIFPKNYTVRFDAKGYGESTDVYVESGSKLIKLPSINGDATGNRILGWYSSKDGGDTYDRFVGHPGDEVIFAGPYTLYAKCEPIDYTIRYVANGGKFKNNIENYTVGKTFNNDIVLEIPTRNGYTFDNWYKESDFVNIYDGCSDLTTIDNDRTYIYANWIENEYTINYHNVDVMDGVSWLPVGYIPKATRSYTEEVVLPKAENLSKFDGVNYYIFKGWYKDNTLSGNRMITIPAKTPENIDCYAKWALMGVVKYDMQGHGATPSSINVEQGLKATRPTNPTEVGYTFKGWFTDTSYTTEWNFTTMPVTENMTLYAKWQANTYTIKYNANGGSISPTQVSKTYNTNIVLASPSKVGYTFVGWYKESGLINIYDGTTDLSTTQGAIVNIYAKWNENSYTLKLNPNFVSTDETGVGIETNETLTYTQVKQLSNPFTSDKYNFVKWNAEANGTGTNYSLNQNVSKLASEDGTEVILYAQWQKGTYTVKFDKNSATSGTMVNKTYTCDTETLLPTNSFVKTGYKFIGWATASNANVLYTNGQSVNNLAFKGQIVTLYAKWEEIKYNLILDPNISGQTGTVTGNALTLTDKTYEENIILNNSVPFESTTHSFGGWSKVSGMNNVKTYDEGATVNKLTTVDGATITLYAKWIPGSYKVIFNGNGATSGSMGIQSIEVGKSAKLTSNAYVKTGYTFLGWATTSNATSPIYTNAQTYSDNTAIKDQENILYAVWKVNTYNVKYNPNGGTISPTTVQKTYGSDIVLASPSRVGYTFVGWYKENGLINIYDGTEDLSASQDATVNIYAKWSENLYNITLHENGGIYGSAYAVPTNRLYTKSTTLSTNINVTKTGYTFGGWYDNSVFAGSAITSIPANTASNKEYWLKWNENSYTITYNTNGGTFITALTDADKKRLYTEGKTLKTDITKEGYTFGGWYEMPDFTDPQAVSNIEANTTANRIFYAKWNIETYTVTFNSNGGNAVASQDVQYNQKAVKPTNPTKSHAIFKHWYITDENVAYNFDTVITGNLILIAKYDVTHEVIFNTDSGTTIQTQQVIDGNKAIKPVNPTKDQHKFIRWYKNGESDTTDFDFNTSITSDLQLNAKWEAIQTYTVSFNMNGVGVAIENQYVVENTKAVDPSSPTIEGYTFVRWYTIDENVAYNFNNIVTANTIINAKWNENSYTISYNVNGGTFITVPTDADKKRLYTESKTLFTSIERDGFIFDGWYENSDFSGTAITTILANTAKNYTLYAKWHVDPSKKQVSFNSNGGLSVPALAATSGNTITAPANPIKSGYTFEGWFTDIELTHQFDFATPITESIILYAKWNQNNSVNNPSGSYRRNNVGGGGGGGSGGGSGARNKNDIKKSLPNSITTTTTKVNMKSNISTTLHSENTTWNYDPVSNKWGLYINDTQTKANNGFYKISEVENQVINDITIPTIVESTYCFDENGNMLTGWVQTLDNVWYFFDTVSATLGKEINNTWKLIDGVWYYFGVDGKMYQNTAGIPGYLVDANGALIDYTGAIAQILSTLYNAKSLDGVTSPIG